MFLYVVNLILLLKLRLYEYNLNDLSLCHMLIFNPDVIHFLSLALLLDNRFSGKHLLYALL